MTLWELQAAAPSANVSTRREKVEAMSRMDRKVTRLLALAIGMQGGCSPSPQDSTPDVVDTGSSVTECDHELSVGPDGSVVETHSLVQLRAEGGTGAFRFTLVEDSSGAEVGSATGAYVAGASPGGTDRIRVEDDGCTGSAEVSVEVVSALQVSPSEAEVPFGTAVEIEVSGGSGEWTCSLSTDASGAGIDSPCLYTSGSSEGLDIVRVHDEITGTSLDVELDVSEAHDLVLAGRGQVFVAEGSTWIPSGQGGSGTLDLEVLDGPLELDGDGVLATSAGAGSVRVSDRYVPELSVDVPVTVLQAQVVELDRDGERSGEGVALGLGDVDGDGHPDAALGFVELSLGAWYSGGVAIYAGTGDGLDPEPVKVIGGTDDQQTLGRALAVADLDGDGQVELLLGADRTDRGSTNNGAVFIYSGEAGSFFGDEPSRSLYGANSYGRMGSALAVCDFNGDGSLDIAAGALDDADENVAVPTEEQGAVHIFLGTDGAFEDKADFVLYGVVPAGEDDEDDDGDGWASQAGMKLGTALAAGDFDGDGLCDLAGGAPEANDEDGVVLVWLGTEEEGEGLVRTPAALIIGDEGSELGRRMSAGDVDGDGRSDLFLAAWKSDVGALGAGGVSLFMGADLDLSGGTSGMHALEASWLRHGTSSYERVGTAVDVADLDGDGLAELIIGAYRDEVDTGVNEGTVTVFEGAAVASGGAGHDATGEDPWMVMQGLDAYDRLGQAVGHLGDLDGDGSGDLLALAGYDSELGIEAGAPYFLSGQDDATPELLAMPGESAGHAVGQAMALVDADGDGLPELLVGAPEAGDALVGANAGVLFAFELTGDGEVTGPGEAMLGGHSEHDATDRFAYSVASAGDFDGDGLEDLVIVSRKDARPSSFDEDETANPDDCAGSRTQAGAGYIYLGQPSGFGSLSGGEPDFAWYGPDAYGTVTEALGGFDRDGDGYGDLVVGSASWGEGGGFGIVYGRSASGSGTTVLCDAETYMADSEFDRLGTSLAILGDLDEDGCDELVVGASGEEANEDYVNQGVIRLVWGTCSGTPRVSTLALNVVGTEAGTSVDAGLDVDGDGLPDLVVGAAAYRQDFAEVGAAWLVTGDYLLGLEPDVHDLGELPEDSTLHLLLPGDGLLSRQGVRGDEAGAYFGEAVALVPDPLDPTRALLAVGTPLGGIGGTDRSGGVALYRYDVGIDGLMALDEVPWGLVVGESAAPGGELGATLLGAELGGRPALVVGAPSSDAGSLDGGAVFLAVFE